MYQYIIVRTDIPLGHQLNCCAHAAALCTAKFINDPNMLPWLSNPYTVSVEVADEESMVLAHTLLGEDNSYMFIEPDLNTTACAVATRPRPKHEYPQWIRKLPLAHRGCHSVKLSKSVLKDSA